MPNTSRDYFDTVTGAGWTDVATLEGGTGDATDQITSGFGTATITMSDPGNGGEIPAGATITDIEIRINCEWEFFSTGKACRIGELNIDGGSNKVSTSIPAETVITRTFTGDLAYWGITEAQAADFAAGTANASFKFEDIGTAVNYTVHVYYIDVLFTYARKVVAAPVML